MGAFYVKIRQCFLIVPILLVSACSSPEERAQSYYDRGIALIEKHDDFAARSELLYAVKYKSDKIEAWRALAGINERVKAYNLLFDDLRRIVELDPTDVEARIKLAKMLLAGGASEAALKVVERGEDPVNKNAELLALKASILVKMKDTNAGVIEARTATELDPGNVDAAVVLALDKTSRGDLDGAIKILSAPNIVSKNDPRVEQIRAQIFAKKGDFSQAEGILQKLINQKPQDIALHDQLVRIFVAERRFDDAEKELRTIAGAHPDDVGTQLNLVRFLGGTKGLDVARDELVNRIKAGGDVFAYQMALADIDFEQGKIDESAALLEGLIAAKSSPEHTLAAQSKLAEFYLRKANYPAAEKLASDILNKDPRNTAGLRIRASIRMEQGQLESAIGDLREALNGQPKSSQLLLLLALAYERDGKLELADRQYADATKSASGNPAVSLQYVAFLQRHGRVAQAEDVLTAAAGANPGNIDLLSALAQIRLVRQNWTGALAVADSIEAIGNQRGVAEEIRGIAFAGQNKMEQSIAALEAAHASRPDAVQPVVTLVTAYLRTGKADKAETLLNDMLKRYPENAQLSLLMGSTQLAKNNNEEAISSFKRVITQHPKDASGYNALADLYVRQKNYDQAAKVLQEGLRQQPDNTNLNLALAGVMIEMGDQDGAIVKYESILKDKPNLPLAMNNLASLLLDYRNDKDSFDRALSLAARLKDSNLPQFQDTLGWAQYRTGDFKGAIDTLEQAEIKLPTLATIRYHLGMSYIGAGQTGKATEQLRAALELEPDGSPLKDKIRSALKQN